MPGDRDAGAPYIRISANYHQITAEATAPFRRIPLVPGRGPQRER